MLKPPDAVIVDDTRRWLERAVIGLNLCPFAKAVHAKGGAVPHERVNVRHPEKHTLQAIRFDYRARRGAASLSRRTLLIAGQASNFV